MLSRLEASPSAGNYGEQMTKPMRGVGSGAISFAGQAARAAGPHLAAAAAQTVSTLVAGTDPLTSLGNIAVPQNERNALISEYVATKPSASASKRATGVAEATRGAGSALGSGGGGGGGSLSGFGSTTHQYPFTRQAEASKISRRFERMDEAYKIYSSRKANGYTGRPRSRGRSRNRHNRTVAAGRNATRSRNRNNRSGADGRRRSKSRNRNNRSGAAGRRRSKSGNRNKPLTLSEILRREKEYPGFKGRFKQDGTPNYRTIEGREWRERQGKEYQ